jgi:hypothetical protein
MAFIRSAITKRIDVPHEPGEWVVICQLSNRTVETIKADHPGPSVRWGWSVSGIYALLLACVVQWSYPEAPSADLVVDGKTVKAIDTLDSPTATWLTSEVMGYLFGSETPQEKKDGTSASTAT